MTPELLQHSVILSAAKELGSAQETEIPRCARNDSETHMLHYLCRVYSLAALIADAVERPPRALGEVALQVRGQLILKRTVARDERVSVCRISTGCGRNRFHPIGERDFSRKSLLRIM
jgi:hypothetical protein